MALAQPGGRNLREGPLHRDPRLPRTRRGNRCRAEWKAWVAYPLAHVLGMDECRPVGPEGGVMSTSGVEPKNSGDNEHETGSGRDDARTVLWSFSYGSRPNTVRADERYPGSTMRVRYRDPNKSGRDKRAEITVELRVRKSASAAVDPKLESRVKRVIIDMHKRQSAGLLPTENAPSRNRNVPDDSKESLTIEQGFELALHPDT